MRRIAVAVLSVFLLASSLPEAGAGEAPLIPSTAKPPSVHAPDRLQSFTDPAVTKVAPRYAPQARGSFRSPRMGYTGGTRTRTPVPGTTPVTRTPAAPATRTGGLFGGLFGGFVAGSLLGSLLHPFGYGGMFGGGASILGLLLWAVILYAVYRLVRRLFQRER